MALEGMGMPVVLVRGRTKNARESVRWAKQIQWTSLQENKRHILTLLMPMFVVQEIYNRSFGLG
jgi:hypothetical protein